MNSRKLRMHDRYIIPAQPRLEWKALVPGFRRNTSLARKSGHRVILGRNGIYHGLAALGLKPGDNVLVPSYHCKALVEAILQYGSEAKFYDINLDLTANFEDVKEKIDQRTKAILLIHYFGFPQSISRYRELRETHDLYLIEDCAHVLPGSTAKGVALGESGDIAIFSWRKFFPLYDGGELAINNPGLTLRLNLEKGSLSFRLKVAKNTLDRLFEDSRWLSYLWKASSSVIKRLNVVRAVAVSVQRLNTHDAEFDRDNVGLAMSAISERIVARTPIQETIAKRRRNYEVLAFALRQMRGVTPLFPDLPEGVCPWVFPIFAPGTRDFARLLRQKGIPAAAWGGVIHSSLPLHLFPTARLLYDHLVFLPIHQGLEERDLNTMLQVLTESLNENVGVHATDSDDCVSLPTFSGR
jgi:perosamine synthetase